MDRCAYWEWRYITWVIRTLGVWYWWWYADAQAFADGKCAVSDADRSF